VPRQACQNTSVILVRLFVYGTLKRGFSNQERLRGATFEREASTAAGHALHSAGAYPALARTGAGVVHGEVYWLSPEHLAEIDEFEGCPHLYQRGEIALEDGTRAAAYLVSGERASTYPLIPGGIWTEAADRGPILAQTV